MTVPPKLKLAPVGAECHPSKIAVFSSEDLPQATEKSYELLATKPAVEINGVVMKMLVSPLVAKGSILIVDRDKLSKTWPDEEKVDV